MSASGFLSFGGAKKGIGSICRDGSQGATHKLDLSPFSPPGRSIDWYKVKRRNLLGTLIHENNSKLGNAKYLPPKSHGSTTARLVDILRSGHYDVSLSEPEMVRWSSWGRLSMDKATSVQALPGSRVRCREVNGQLVLHLPSQPGRVLKATAGFLLCVAALPIVAHFIAGGDAWVFGLFIVSLGVPLVLILLVWGILAAQRHATETFVLITRETLIVKTVLFGRERLREYTVTEKSRASQFVQSPTEDEEPRPACGVSITTQQGEVEFGEGLSQGERDWVEWRVNRHLGQATNTDASAAAARAGVTEEPVPRPADTLIRIENDYFETRVDFPNSVQRRSFSGTWSVIVGIGWSACFLFAILRLRNLRHVTIDAHLAMYGLFVVFGLLTVLGGLAQLFGKRRLTITAEKITDRGGLFGISWRRTLPTAEVVSCGLREVRQGRGGGIAPAKGCVIRTAQRALRFGQWLESDEEAEWLAGEVARRIDAFRSAP